MREHARWAKELNTLLTMIQTQIADFGMSRELALSDYYVSHGGKIPVKWTAPEVLLCMS